MRSSLVLAGCSRKLRRWSSGIGGLCVSLTACVSLAACEPEDPPAPSVDAGSTQSSSSASSSMGGSTTSGAAAPMTTGGGGATSTMTGTTNTATTAMGGASVSSVSAGTGAGGSGTTATGTGTETSTTGELIDDTFAGDINVEVHEEVNTILVVTWTQLMAADNVWLEFSYEGGEVMTSRPSAGELGEHRDVVLGVPGETAVTIRIVSEVGGVEYKSSEFEGVTEAVPSGMPEPEVLSYDPELAGPERWMFGAVEDSDGGCTSLACYYHTTFWVYIMNRQGQVVWYYADPASNATSSFQRVARDGEYIWIEKRPFSGGGSRGVLKMTLDWEYYEEVSVPGLSDCIDVTDDGSLLYDVVQAWELREMTRDGQVRTIWNCPDHFQGGFQCYSNTINWNELDDTVLLSFPEENTVIEIDRQTGDVVGQYGDANGSYAFSPDTWEFEFQHFANITPDGTLLVSSHMPGFSDTEDPVAGQHAFMEFEIDRENETLIEHWIYNEGPEWAIYKGMAMRTPSGNTLANYGTGGVIREITPDKQTAFHVKFDTPGGTDMANKMVGHNVLIDDLYALNGGGPE